MGTCGERSQGRGTSVCKPGESKSVSGKSWQTSNLSSRTPVPCVPWWAFNGEILKTPWLGWGGRGFPGLQPGPYHSESLASGH